MSVPLLGLAADTVSANFDRHKLPYKVTLVATYHCNFRCEMCSIWQKDSVGEMTPAEAETFFRKWPQFSWVHLTGGELFMRRDLEDLVNAIVDRDRSLYLLNFPTTGWFGDRTVSLVEGILRRGIGRLMTTISIDGPKALHEEMRGLPGSWDKGIETFRRLRGIRRSNFQTVVGMTLMAKNAGKVDETLAAIREVIPDFRRSELHLNVGHESGHYVDNVGYPVEQHHVAILRAIDDHRKRNGSPLHPVSALTATVCASQTWRIVFPISEPTLVIGSNRVGSSHNPGRRRLAPAARAYLSEPPQHRRDFETDGPGATQGPCERGRMHGLLATAQGDSPPRHVHWRRRDDAGLRMCRGRFR